jgi:hypothetical protein
MIAHVAQRLFPDASIVQPPLAAPAKTVRTGGGKVLGVLSPLPDAGAEALTIAIARALRRRGDPARIVLFGSCLDDLAAMAPGNVLVTGAMASEDLAEMVGLHGVTELMACSRTRFFARVDALASHHGLAQAGFDWSSRAIPLKPGDLALDPRLCDRKIAEQVADWMFARRQADIETPAPAEAADTQ